MGVRIKDKVGRLDQRIEIHKPTETRDLMGGVQLDYTLFCYAFASVDQTPSGDRNNEVSGKQTAKRRTEFIIRYVPNLEEDFVIKHYDNALGENDYLIKSINTITDERRNAFLVITAEEYDVDVLQDGTDPSAPEIGLLLEENNSKSCGAIYLEENFVLPIIVEQSVKLA